MRLITNASLDVVDHVFPDDRFAMRFTHVLDGATNHFSVVLGASVPGAPGYKRTTFEQSHVFLLIFYSFTSLQVEGHEG